MTTGSYDYSFGGSSKRKNNFERRATTLTEDLEEMERTDPEVKKAKKALDDTAARILNKGPALSYDDIRTIYGDQTWKGKS